MKSNTQLMRIRRGFSVIELLVTIAVIGLLMALIVPAVQAARESARATQCKNNLKQIGLAINSFESQHRFLPPSRTYDHYTTWAFVILPHMEQVNLFDSWDPKVKYYYQTDEARLTAIPGYFCPSRRSSGISTAGDDILSPLETSDHVPGTLSDYACSAGFGNGWNWIDSKGAMIIGQATTDPPTIPFGNFAPPNATLVSWRGRTTMQSLTDGASNTILVGEKHVRPDRIGIAQEDGAIYNGDHPGNFSRAGGPGYPIARFPEDNFNNNFGSYHRGRCHFVMGDGSVLGISPLIATDILGRLTTRNDGNPISGTDY
ncbi:MAG: DUF1559 domain-containing protein [Planctomycetaceae bacterium]